jgi:hypothetical protein
MSGTREEQLVREAVSQVLSTKRRGDRNGQLRVKWVLDESLNRRQKEGGYHTDAVREYRERQSLGKHRKIGKVWGDVPAEMVGSSGASSRGASKGPCL